MVMLRDILEDNIEKLKSLYDDYKAYLDDIILEIDEEEIDKEDIPKVIEEFKSKLVVVNDLVNENDKELINLLISKIDDVSNLNTISEYLIGLKSDFIGNIGEYIQNTYYNNSFEEDNELCKFCNLDGEIFFIQIKGWFVIDAGNADDIYLDYKKDDKLIERGEINIIFGDYSIADYGAPMPEQEQDIYMNIDSVKDQVECDIEGIIEELQKNIDNISQYFD